MSAPQANRQVDHLARVMVYLERQIAIAELSDNPARAATLRANRDGVQFRRSVLLRQRWAFERGRYEASGQA